MFLYSLIYLFELFELLTFLYISLLIVKLNVYNNSVGKYILINRIDIKYLNFTPSLQFI